MILRTAACFLCALAMCVPAMAGEVLVAAATSVAAPVRAIAESFHRETGNTVVISSGPTSRLYEQIRAGAPYDVLLAGNDIVPARLEQENQAVPGTRYTYATQVLALWSPQEGYVDPNGEVLRHNDFSQLSIASADVPPYGRPALQVLDRLGLTQAVSSKLVERPPSAREAKHLMAAGKVELGFVTLSQVYANSKLMRGSAWIVPTSLYDPVKQDAVLLARGKENLTARSFIFYLKGPRAGAVFLANGFYR